MDPKDLIAAPNFRTCRMVLEPSNILVAWYAPGFDYVLADLKGWCRARIAPLLDLRVAIAKGKAAGPIMIHPGQILVERVQRRVVRRETIHVGQKISPVDDVLALIQE